MTAETKKEILRLVQNYGATMGQAMEAEANGNNYNAARREQDAEEYLRQIDALLPEDDVEKNDK